MCVFKKKTHQVFGMKTHVQCMIIKAYIFQEETITSSMTDYVQ